MTDEQTDPKAAIADPEAAVEDAPTAEAEPVGDNDSERPVTDETASAFTLAPNVPAAADTVSPLGRPDSTGLDSTAGGSTALDSTGPAIVAPPPDYSATGVPSLDFVRDKIEGRYARSLGSTELAEGTPEARSFEEQAAQREEAAQEKLAAIRRSLRDGSSS